MLEGGLFSVRCWLGFQGNQLIFGPGQTQVHREINVWKPGKLFDFPLSVECSNSNRHFVWNGLTVKDFPGWLIYSKYLDGAFCLLRVFFVVQCGRNTNKQDKLYT